MNIPVSERIKTIVVNMERCRWITPEFFRAEEYIYVNIPSYTMKLILNGKLEIESRVVVGKSMTETAIFSGNMSYIVFSPYRYIPASIIKKEIRPGMKKSRKYLKTTIWNGTMGKFANYQAKTILLAW